VQTEAQRHATRVVRFIRELATARTSWDAGAIATALLLLPIAYAEPVLIPSWSLRMVVALLVVPLGLARLGRDVLRRDRPATWLTGLMMSCTLGTLTAGAPLWNIRGGFGRDSSLTFLVILASFWAGARSLDRAGRRLGIVASLVGAAISGVVAVIQVIVVPTTGILALVGDRPGGLLDNPVYLGAISAGACALAAIAWSRGSTPQVLGFWAVALFTACVSLSGSRGALVGATAGVVAGFLTADRRTRAMLAASVGSGWLVALVLANLNDGRDVLARASLDDDGRSTVWSYAAQAFADRPLLGHGFGQFRNAVQPYFEPDFVRDHAFSPTASGWSDAHNVVIQYAVVGGLVAVAFLGLFTWSAVRQARGPTAWAAGAVALTWLLQPVTLATGPICLAWLGMAMASKTSNSIDSVDVVDEASSNGLPTRFLVLLGVVMAFGLFAVDQRLHRDVDDAAAFTGRIEVLPSDPLLASRASELNLEIGDIDEAVRWARRRTGLEPFDAVAGAALAEQLIDAGRPTEAEAEIRRSLEQDPLNPTALRAGLGIALVTKDDELFELVTTRLDELGLD
jgi:hypothetical protein